MLTRSSYRHSKPAPRNAAGPAKSITEDVTWDRIVSPHESYRIIYQKDSERSERVIELTKIGHSGEFRYLGAMHEGKFKIFRADRIVDVLQQISSGHAPSIHAAPHYSTTLPPFPLPDESDGKFKVPALAAYSTRTWTVDLRSYTCTCPEKRIRKAKGYAPGQLGYTCAHLAKAILEHLPTDAPSWTEDLRAFLSDSRKMHVDNLVKREN